ncbi:SMC-Scp complex subunit ScpB [Siculibacillus lacustris]|uniref:SMC-Scp complex subunit ScpB n=1 Tax=Siculibacillus lacustris TaxID=1549641 RepID=A0A4Q9VQS2_9HYPH|nr:SMC-Scp complex subunit ScpB [Siculibacillus lacustris]
MPPVTDGRAEAAAADDLFTAEAATEARRLVEALIFASTEPVAEADLALHVPASIDLAALLARLVADYRGRGVELVRVAGRWQFRTAADLAPHLTRSMVEPRKLGRPALETLAIIAYHQPVTRAEIEQIRGVAVARGTLDVLLETGWIRMRGRRRTPGRPVTWGTTDGFLVHFGLDAIQDLPGLEELKGAGLLDGQIPAGFQVPVPTDAPQLGPDEDPLDPADLLDLEDPDADAGSLAEDDGAP